MGSALQNAPTYQTPIASLLHQNTGVKGAMSRMPSSTLSGARPLFGSQKCAHYVIRRCGSLALASSRRELLVSTTTTLLGAAAMSGSPAASAAGPVQAIASAEPAIPRTILAPGLEISRVVKGCWQLSGGHGWVATPPTSCPASSQPPGLSSVQLGF
jgi:hypothetical protein